MRQPRIKVDPATDQAVYHCMTRVVNKERHFNDPAGEIFRRQLWLVAEYCGVELLTIFHPEHSISWSKVDRSGMETIPLSVESERSAGSRIQT